MTIYFRTIAGVLVAVILMLVLSKQGKDMSVLLGIAVCCMIFTVSVQFLRPIISFFDELKQLGDLDTELFEIIIKTVCLGLLGEITSLICNDSGNAALGKSIQILTVGVIVWLGLPMFRELISLISRILGSV